MALGATKQDEGHHNDVDDAANKYVPELMNPKDATQIWLPRLCEWKQVAIHDPANEELNLTNLAVDEINSRWQRRPFTPSPQHFTGNPH